MLRAWRWFWVGMWTFLIGFVIGRNVMKYKSKGLMWNSGKSLLDLIVIGLSAIYLPAFLVAIDGAWISEFFTNKWAKLAVGVGSGILLGIVSVYSMEVIILLSIFGVDAKTGTEGGILKRWSDVTTSEHTGEEVAA